MVRDVDLSSPAVRFSAASLPNGRGFCSTGGVEGAVLASVALLRGSGQNC